MDENSIGLVLARASELRSKITNCIHRASTLQAEHNREQEQEREDEANGGQSQDKVGEEGTDTLLNIGDALGSLEAQLSSLQALQQQQWYEREAALAEIDYSRKKLLEKLNEYKGEDLDVIHEAAGFASETVEDNNDLLLPYPTQPDNGYPPHYPSQKFTQNGLINGDTAVGTKKSGPRFLPRGLRHFINGVAKTVLTLVGVVSVLSLAGFEPRVRKRGPEFMVFGLFQQRGTESEGEMVQCPPGKVLVVEDGEARCLVKERVEIPFESVVATPNVNYGCG